MRRHAEIAESQAKQISDRNSYIDAIIYTFKQKKECLETIYCYVNGILKHISWVQLKSFMSHTTIDIQQR